VFQRVLGHKEMIPGSGQWYESSNTNIPNSLHYKHKCWICDGQVFSLVFWSRKYAFHLKPVFSSTNGQGKEVQDILYEIDRLPADVIPGDPVNPGMGHAHAEGVPYDQLDNQVPYLAGDFTGWRYKKMIPVHQITKNMDRDYCKLFDWCKSIGKIKRHNDTIEECSKRERKDLNAVRTRQALKYTYGDGGAGAPGWPSFIKQMRYKKPFIVNGYEMNDMF